MLPLSLAYIIILATLVLVLESSGMRLGSMGFNLVMLAVNAVLVFVIVWLIDRGRIISPAYSRLNTRDVEKLRRVYLERSQAVEGAD
jgi:hypothetical protein